MDIDDTAILGKFKQDKSRENQKKQDGRLETKEDEGGQRERMDEERKSPGALGG